MVPLLLTISSESDVWDALHPGPLLLLTASLNICVALQHWMLKKWEALSMEKTTATLLLTFSHSPDQKP